MQEGVYPEYVPGSNQEQFAPAYAERLDAVASGLTDKDIGDRVFPHFIAKYLPPGLTGLLVAAVFAAAMSTVSTSLNSSATLVMTDYYRRFIRPDATERQCMLTLYLSTIVWGILGIGMALILVRLTESALDIWWTLSGIFGGGMCGLFLLGMISRRAKNPAAAAGVLVGIVAILWLSIPKAIDYLAKQPDGSWAHDAAIRLQESMTGCLSPFHAFMIPVFRNLDHPAGRPPGQPLRPAQPASRPINNPRSGGIPVAAPTTQT